MERTRKRLNRGLRTYVLQNNSYAIAHPDFDDSYSALCDDDGVHLSFIGQDIFINTIQEALFQFLRYPNCNVIQWRAHECRLLMYILIMMMIEMLNMLLKLIFK
jgi:hypothetical protein